MARQVEVFAQWSLRMPIEQVSGTGLSYHLINFDAVGRERVEPDGEPVCLDRSTYQKNYERPLYLIRD